VAGRQDDERRDERARAAQAIFDAVPEEYRHLISASSLDYTDIAETALVPLAPVLVKPFKQLTTAETVSLEAELIMLRLFGDRFTDDVLKSSAFTQSTNEQGGFEKLYTLIRDVVLQEEPTIRQIVEEELAKSNGAEKRGAA